MFRLGKVTYKYFWHRTYFCNQNIKLRIFKTNGAYSYKISLIPSSKSKPLLNVDNFLYYKRQERRNGDIYWTCKQMYTNDVDRIIAHSSDVQLEILAKASR